MHPEPNPNPIAAANDSNPNPKPPGRGRPRALDDAKRREICALIAGGCGLREAAKYVRCGTNTIRREADRNPEFHDQLRRSEAYAQLSPLRAMQQAVGTHWRAAAWMLERAFPERFARPEPGAFGARQARQLLGEVLHVVSSELADPFKYDRIEKRIRGTFEYHIRAACDRHRTTRNLRRAMTFFDDKDQDPLAQFGIAAPDFDALMKSRVGRGPIVGRGSPRVGSPDPAHRPTEGLRSGSSPAHPTTEGLPSDSSPPATMADFANALREKASDLATTHSAATSIPAPPEPNNQ